MPTVADELAASRRPLNSRGWRWTNAAASWLTRAGVTPNAISLFSIACAAFAAGGFALARYATSPWLDALGYLLVIAGIQSRLLCNLFDGMVAIEGGHRTPAGELFNETPDRVADALILVAAGYAADPTYGPTLGWLAALLAMATAYVRVLGKACGAVPYFTGPMAKQQRMAVMTVTCMICMLLALMNADIWPQIHQGHIRVTVFPPSIATAPAKVLSITLAIVCLGCVSTIWNRLSLIATSLNSKAAR